MKDHSFILSEDEDSDLLREICQSESPGMGINWEQKKVRNISYGTGKG